jgi:hypothetical protein
VFHVILLVVAACAFGLAASMLVHHASNVAPIWNVVAAILLVMVLAGVALAILTFAKNRAFPN